MKQSTPYGGRGGLRLFPVGSQTASPTGLLLLLLLLLMLMYCISLQHLVLLVERAVDNYLQKHQEQKGGHAPLGTFRAAECPHPASLVIQLVRQHVSTDAQQRRQTRVAGTGTYKQSTAVYLVVTFDGIPASWRRSVCADYRYLPTGLSNKMSSTNRSRSAFSLKKTRDSISNFEQQKWICPRIHIHTYRAEHDLSTQL